MSNTIPLDVWKAAKKDMDEGVVCWERIQRMRIDASAAGKPSIGPLEIVGIRKYYADGRVEEHLYEQEAADGDI